MCPATVVRFVGQRGSTDSSYQAALGNAGNHIISSFGADRNTSIRPTLNGSPVRLRPNYALRDFLDLSVTVYLSDTLASREAEPDRWHRKLSFIVPVRQPSIWSANSDLLVNTLSFLTGDNVTLSWLERASLPPLTQAHRVRLTKAFDAICLFSGGIDSLIGAYQLLRDGQRVLLVGHHADSTTSGAQKRVIQALRNEFGDHVGFLQWGVTRSHNNSPRYPLQAAIEKSHRSRSFLFLALGTIAAKMLDVEQVFIPENGLIALNAPLQRGRMGSHSTRTAHPKYLLLLKQWLSSMDLYNGELLNPLMYKHKAELVIEADEFLKNLFPLTVSCSHGNVRTLRRGSKNHCGYCVPCLYRRTAFIGAQIDVSRFWAIDVFREFENLTDTQSANIRALVQFARGIMQMSTLAREAVVLSHGYFSADEARSLDPANFEGGYSNWTGMLTRWAEQFLGAVSDASSVRVRRILEL